MPIHEAPILAYLELIGIRSGFLPDFNFATLESRSQIAREPLSAPTVYCL